MVIMTISLILKEFHKIMYNSNKMNTNSRKYLTNTRIRLQLDRVIFQFKWLSHPLLNINKINYYNYLEVFTKGMQYKDWIVIRE